jgi:hypothetical protein
MQPGMHPHMQHPGMQPGMQPGMPPHMQHPGMQQPPQASGPNKTVALQSTEGIVSIARTGQAVQPAGTGAIQQGASTLFWIVSLILGIAIGAIAYAIARAA